MAKKRTFLCDQRGTNPELARWAAHICWLFSFAFKNCANVAEKKCHTESLGCKKSELPTSPEEDLLSRHTNGNLILFVAS